MNFTDIKELSEIKNLVRRFAENEIRPHVREWDETQTFPRGTLQELGRLGFMGVVLPMEYGGAGLGYTEYVAILEELSRVDGSIGLSVAAHTSLCSAHLFQFGSEEQRRQYVVPLARGEKIGGWCLTEPESGSDAGALRTTARLEGDEWVLNGEKSFITHGTAGDIFVVMASTGGDRHHGISAFIVEKGAFGFIAGRKEDKLGLRASDTAGLSFQDCRIPAGNLLGRLGSGFADAMTVLDAGRISIAAFTLGMAQGAFEAALKYSAVRKQFGKRICEFQAIQFKLADMATEIEAARLLVQRAASMKDQGVNTTLASSIAKLYSSEVAVRVANECVQIFGGYGYLKDYPAEKYYRDVKLGTIGEGTSEIQRLVIARQLLQNVAGGAVPSATR
jgi:alkylation response protein AidB-like acyl-CoA dehydrogenase